LARGCRKQILAGIDPLVAREGERNARRLEKAKAITFADCAAKCIAAMRAAWRNEKHGSQWESTLTTYAYPVIGKLSVGDIDTGHVTRILEPIWTTKTETASRVRGRIETILDYATTQGWRSGENPARWRGHLENVLAKKSKVAKVEHHAALPWREIGAFMQALKAQKGVAALALRFTILTAARTGEVLEAGWCEINLEQRVWTIPAGRMKAEREHRKPLTDEALAILSVVEELRVAPPDARTAGSDFVFPGAKKGKPLSNNTMLALLRRMGRSDVTTHGFRSSFRDWAAETGQPSDIAEAALAHTVGSKVQAAYQRGDMLDRRRKLMDDWAAWCARIAQRSQE
jgi:integrase